MGNERWRQFDLPNVACSNAAAAASAVAELSEHITRHGQRESQAENSDGIAIRIAGYVKPTSEGQHSLLH